MAIEMERHLLTVDQFEEIARAGILGPDERVELIEGELIEMPAPSPEHSMATRGLTKAFYASIADRAIIFVQDGVRLPPRSAPQPDLLLAAPPDEQYHHRTPEPSEILLVIEVSHTTQAYDRGTKMPLYARHGIREAWLLDVPARIVEVYRNPGPDGYRRMETIDADGSLSPEAFPDVEIAVGPLFPR